MLRAQTEPVSLGALAAHTRLHANTVREHLEALRHLGLVARHPAAASGRGRPAWLYEATGAEPGSSEYAGLAAALADSIHRTSDAPTKAATEAGMNWGRRLVRDRGSSAGDGDAPDDGGAAARREVVALLDDLGFGPRTDDDDEAVVHLTRCPLLAAAHQYPDVVCGVHLGLVRGALEEYGAESSDAELEPFAEPGACLLRMRHA